MSGELGTRWHPVRKIRTHFHESSSAGHDLPNARIPVVVIQVHRATLECIFRCERTQNAVVVKLIEVHQERDVATHQLNLCRILPLKDALLTTSIIIRVEG
jgi:hypothetical protein